MIILGSAIRCWNQRKFIRFKSIIIPVYNSEKIIPDYVKADPSKNAKIESLKDSHGMRVCDRKDLEYMRTEYNVIPIKGEIKKLGSTGIQLYYDDKTNNFIIKR